MINKKIVDRKTAIQSRKRKEDKLKKQQDAKPQVEMEPSNYRSGMFLLAKNMGVWIGGVECVCESSCSHIVVEVRGADLC